MEIRLCQESDREKWDSYVRTHPKGTLYQLSGWKNVIEKSYRHHTYYLMAVENNPGEHKYQENNIIKGVLPLVHIKHIFFGNKLISIPFFDLGGVLADGQDIEKTLLLKAAELGRKLKINNIELRHTESLSWLIDDRLGPAPNPMHHALCFKPSDPRSLTSDLGSLPSTPCSVHLATRSHKVRMLLDLPESSESLMKSFKSKLRSQIKKPIKEGLKTMLGGIELLDSFYMVFSENMRDLGSPVHSKELIKSVLEEFQETVRIVLVYKNRQPLACSLVVGFKGILENPWASSLREYSRLSPNMLLYWTMLEYACENGFKQFDFGRSTPDEGTFKFKEQWGAQPTPLHWQYIIFNGHPLDTSEKSKFDKAVQYWQKLPVPVTKLIGPPIRKYIGL